jgi:hypothetical protein
MPWRAVEITTLEITTLPTAYACPVSGDPAIPQCRPAGRSMSRPIAAEALTWFAQVRRPGTTTRAEIAAIVPQVAAIVPQVVDDPP